MLESTFIRHLLRTDPPGTASVLLPTGDDMAMLAVEGARVLAAIDAVVEGRHFRPGTDLRLVARKALLRNLSDVAAMAARPLACVASVTLPRGASDADAWALLDGLREVAQAFACPLVGGDTTVHAGDDPLVVSVAILAVPALRGGRVITRHGSRLGDLVAVTGELGGSLEADGGGRHLEFPPRIPEAIALAEALGEELHAMLDLSDGLGIDASRLLAESPSLAIEIDVARIPARRGLGWRRAVGDGEDFELLFTTGAEPPKEVSGTPVRVIGRVVERGDGPTVRLLDGGRVIDGSAMGYDHGREDPR